MEKAELSGQCQTPYRVQQAEAPILATEDEFGQIPHPKKVKIDEVVKHVARHMQIAQHQCYLKMLEAEAADEQVEIATKWMCHASIRQQTNGKGDALDPLSPHYDAALAAPKCLSCVPTPECVVSLSLEETAEQLAAGPDPVPVPDHEQDLSPEFGHDVDDLFGEYIPSYHLSNPDPDSESAVECSWMMDSNSEIVQDYICHCMNGECKDCMICANKSPIWILDSGASSHFMFALSDFSDYEKLPKPEGVMTAGRPIWIIGQGTIIIDHTVISNGKAYMLTMRLSPVMHILNLTHWLLSLGSFLKQGLHIYGNAATISLSEEGKHLPLVQAVPCTSGDTIYIRKTQI
ncbi:hypothetical protein BJV74DRAFT_795693 [Russula compacta]|nr:hypothetical protein BJV74DRAFT_795693 [Russula compacta]